MRWKANYKAFDWVRVKDRVLPRVFEVWSVNDKPMPDVRARFHLIGGAYECREVTLTAVDGGREVNTTDLRSVRPEDLLEIGVDMVGAIVVDETNGVVRVEPHVGEDQRRQTVREVGEARAARRRTINQELLTEVVEVYRANLEDRPTQAVADHFDKSLRTGSLYVQRAREAGLLGEAVTGKAGER